MGILSYFTNIGLLMYFSYYIKGHTQPFLATKCVYKFSWSSETITQTVIVFTILEYCKVILVTIIMTVTSNVNSNDPGTLVFDSWLYLKIQIINPVLYVIIP